MPDERPRGFSFSSFSKGELFVGGGSLLLLISIPIHWMSYSGFAAVGAFNGIGLLVLLVWLAVTLLLVVRSPMFRNTVEVPRLPTTDAVLFAAGGAAELVLLLVFYAHYRGGTAGIHRSVGFGYILALTGSILTVVAGASAIRAGRSGLHDTTHTPPTVKDAPPPPPPPPMGLTETVAPPQAPRPRPENATSEPPPPPPPPLPPGPES
jgi:hypothetical protein